MLSTVLTIYGKNYEVLKTLLPFFNPEISSSSDFKMTCLIITIGLPCFIVFMERSFLLFVSHCKIRCCLNSLYDFQ